MYMCMYVYMYVHSLSLIRFVFVLWTCWVHPVLMYTALIRCTHTHTHDWHVSQDHYHTCRGVQPQWWWQGLPPGGPQVTNMYLYKRAVSLINTCLVLHLSSNEVVTIYGRQVRLSRLGYAPSLYAVCRDWVCGNSSRRDTKGSSIQQVSWLLAVICDTHSLHSNRFPATRRSLRGRQMECVF